jgi:hypothetical protein
VDGELMEATMKRFLAVLVFLLLPVAAHPWGGSVCVVGGGGSAAAGCTYSTKDSQTNTSAIVGWAYMDPAIRQWMATQFTAGSTYDICRFIVKLYRTGTPGVNITAYVYSDSGSDTPGTSIGQTTSTAVVANNLTTNSGGEDVTFNFGSLSLTSGTKYWVVLAADGYGADSSNKVSLRAGGTSSGLLYRSSNGSTWALVSTNAMYYVTYD